MSKRSKGPFNNPVSRKEIEMRQTHLRVPARLDADVHSFSMKPQRKPKASGKRGNR